MGESTNLKNSLIPHQEGFLINSLVTSLLGYSSSHQLYLFLFPFLFHRLRVFTAPQLKQAIIQYLFLPPPALLYLVFHGTLQLT